MNKGYLSLSLFFSNFFNRSMVPISPLAMHNRIQGSYRCGSLYGHLPGSPPPFLSTGTVVYSNPHFSSVFAEFSTKNARWQKQQHVCFFLLGHRQTFIAMLLLSVPLPVKIISSGFPPIKSATCLRAASIASRGTSPIHANRKGFQMIPSGMAASRAVHQVKQVSWPCIQIYFFHLCFHFHTRDNIYSLLLAVR